MNKYRCTDLVTPINKSRLQELYNENSYNYDIIPEMLYSSEVHEVLSVEEVEYNTRRNSYICLCNDGHWWYEDLLNPTRCYVQVHFSDNDNKSYLYEFIDDAIQRVFYREIKKGDYFTIINECNWDYKGQTVVCEDIYWNEIPPLIDLEPRPYKITNIITTCEKKKEPEVSELLINNKLLINEDTLKDYANSIYIDNGCYSDYYVNTGTTTTNLTGALEKTKIAIEKYNKSLKSLNDSLDINIEDNEKGNKEMNIFGKNVEFGKYTTNDIKMSIKGLAYKTTDNTYVTYDAETNDMTDVSDFILDFDARKFLYKMPVAVSDIKIGDIVLHNGKPAFVVDAPAGNEIIIMYPIAKEIKHIIAPKNVFGFNYITKVVDFTNGMFAAGANATADSPFGNNLLPLLLMGEGSDMSDMLPFILMSQNNGQLDQNSLMMFALMSDKGDMNDMLPFLLLSGNSPFTSTPKSKG